MRTGWKTLILLSSICAAILITSWNGNRLLKVETMVIQSGMLVQTRLLNATIQYQREQMVFSPKNGIVSRVCVSAGDRVEAGALLFQLDTSAEEKALSELYRLRYDQNRMLEQMDNTVTALAVQNEMNWQTAETQLLAAIEASKIRATKEGIVEAVYVEEGDYIGASVQLGQVRGEMLTLCAVSAETENVYPGMQAWITETNEKIVLKKIEALDASGQKALFFDCPETLMETYEIGQSVRVELITSEEMADALVPFAAVDADNNVWWLENGSVKCREISCENANRTHMMADAWWREKQVVKYPELYNLQENMMVQVVQ